MESILKFWRIVAPGADVSTVADTMSNFNDDVRNPACEIDEDDTDNDSFFDLVFDSPDLKAYNVDKKLSKKFENDLISKPQSPISILRSAPKFKVFTLGLKKLSKPEKNADLTASPLNQSKRFSFKCKAEEAPVTAVFTRENSLRSKLLKESYEENLNLSPNSAPKDAAPKYLKLIKPLYSKASKKSNQKPSSASVTPLSSPVAAPVNSSPRKITEGSRVSSFKIVTKHLGKSRSASSAVGMTPSPVNRRDDSLLQQLDGIQGAILHCKKSYSCSSKDFSQLSRSISDQSHDKLIQPRRSSCEELKRCSI